MKWSRDHVLTCSYMRVDRLDVIIDRINRISSVVLRLAYTRHRTGWGKAQVCEYELLDCGKIASVVSPEIRKKAFRLL
jgi:hypothetical protein